MSLHLDHIIVLIPYASLLNLPTWLTDNFTITPGGRHAHSSTENKLISFLDGSYIELIAFINDDPANRESHWWGKKEFGIVDYAFTSSPSSLETGLQNFKDVSSRLEKVDWKAGEEALKYEKPLEGGRKRPDGKEIEWVVTFPSYVRGEAPFFCHDVTDRSLRVPFSEESVTHPSGAYGVKSLSLYVPSAKVSPLSKALAAVLDVDNASKNAGEGLFETERLRKVDGVEEERTSFYVKEPKEEWQKEGLEQRGGLYLADFVIGTTKGVQGEEKRIDGSGDDAGLGRWLLAL